MSWYFYSQVSRHGQEPTDKNFIEWARTKYASTYQLDYVRLRDYGSLEESVRGILDDYDFIGVTERLDESLVVLQILLDLNVGDTLYLSAKAGQGTYFYDIWSGGSRCLYKSKSFVSSGMEAYFASEEWQNRIAGDTLLYKSANYSLDKTIDRIGREKVASQLQEFRNALRVATKRCEGKAVFPCSEDGLLQEKESNCYATVDEEGCGYQCLDDVAKDLGY